MVNAEAARAFGQAAQQNAADPLTLHFIGYGNSNLRMIKLIRVSHQPADGDGLEQIVKFQFGYQSDVLVEINLGKIAELGWSQVEFGAEKAVTHGRLAQLVKFFVQPVAIVRSNRTQMQQASIRQGRGGAVAGKLI